MKTFAVLIALWLGGIVSLSAQEPDVNARYIEVTGSSEVEIIPDEIHFMITIKEFWQEEFEAKSKPEDAAEEETVPEEAEEMVADAAEEKAEED